MADKSVEKKRKKLIDKLETISYKFSVARNKGKTNKLPALQAEGEMLAAALLALDDIYPPEEDYKRGRQLSLFVPYPKKYYPEKYEEKTESKTEEKAEARSAEKAEVKEESVPKGYFRCEKCGTLYRYYELACPKCLEDQLNRDLGEDYVREERKKLAEQESDLARENAYKDLMQGIANRTAEQKTLEQKIAEQKAAASRTQKSTTTTQTAVKSSVTAPNGPKIPENNRFAAHEALISRIARRAAQNCARWIRGKSEWKPLNNGYSAEYYVDITVHKDGVDFNKLAYEGLHGIGFANLGMDNIPESSTETFLKAMKPFLDVYFPEEIKKAFSDVSPLIKLSTSVTYDDHHEGWDFDGRSYSKKCIHVSLRYTNPPAPKLKSW